MQRRVAITGLGIVSTFGNEVDRFWDAVLAGQTGGSDIALDGLPTLPGVRVLEFDADEVIGKREARRMDRVGIFAAVAAAQALAELTAARGPSKRRSAHCSNAGSIVSAPSRFRLASSTRPSLEQRGCTTSRVHPQRQPRPVRQGPMRSAGPTSEFAMVAPT